MRRRLIAGLFACAASAGAAAQPSTAVVAVEAGTRLQTIALLDGGRWTAPPADRACDAPGANLIRRRGLAVSAGVAVDAARPLSPGTAEWMRLEPAIGRLFEEREREQRLSSANLSHVRMSVDALYVSPGEDGSQVYYFEAAKRIVDTTPPADADDDGEVDPRGILRVAVTGWLRAKGERVMPVGTKSELHWDQVDERGEAPRRPGLMPLGIVRAGGLPVWAMTARIGDSARFTLYEIGASRVRTLVAAREAQCGSD